MSACLFTLSAQWFEWATRTEIEVGIKEWKRVCEESRNNPEFADGNNRFLTDRYSGYMMNILWAEYVLIGMDKVDEEKR